MKKIKINFRNCYGIRSLETEFDFQNSKAYAIYAPNGIMKTSFSKTMQDHSEGNTSEDRIYKTRETTREIVNEDGSPISSDKIFVIEPYNEVFKSKKISTLLVNKNLKLRYDELHSIINEKKTLLLNKIKSISGLKTDIEEIISDAITHDPKEFFLALNRVKDEVQSGKPSELGKINYLIIFNDKVLALLTDVDFRSNLKEYIQIYDQLTASSTFFKKGVFNHNNAADTAKNLESNGFFRASHTVNVIINGQKKEISSAKDLEEAIQKEKESILENSALASSFESIDSKLTKNSELRKFREYLEANKFILIELDNLDRFKQKLCVAYLIENIDEYNKLMELYEEGRKEIESIIEKAKEEETKWLKVISIFNKRFSVPFVVSMENQVEVILNSEAPNIKFEFKENGHELAIPIEEEALLEVLSSGEKRALYILNIIFEVEARKESGQETLFIIDDIADSFDYKNKYAIAEYLKDISSENGFYQIILSHNFDFYRTISGRLNLGRKQKLHTAKSQSGIQLLEELYQKNPFDHWKENMDSNNEMLISSIPFIRNLAEYCGYESEFEKLTSLLHQKNDTDSITIAALQGVIVTILKDKTSISLPDQDKIVKDVIYNTANSICSETDEVVELEKKIVLSIAIRLKTEEFLVSKINDPLFINQIETNQTYKLIKKYKEIFPLEENNIQLIERVNLMTPENIHLNSFMYEPILDMSSEHLKKLYQEVIKLVIDPQ